MTSCVVDTYKHLHLMMGGVAQPSAVPTSGNRALITEYCCTQGRSHIHALVSLCRLSSVSSLETQNSPHKNHLLYRLLGLRSLRNTSSIHHHDSCCCVPGRVSTTRQQSRNGRRDGLVSDRSSATPLPWCGGLTAGADVLRAAAGDAQQYLGGFRIS